MDTYPRTVLALAAVLLLGACSSLVDQCFWAEDDNAQDESVSDDADVPSPERARPAN